MNKMSALIILILAVWSHALKYDIQIFHGTTDCQTITRAAGYAMFTENDTALTFRDGFSDLFWWRAEIKAMDTNSLLLHWYVADSYLGSVDYRYGQCSFGPINYSVLIRKLDLPIFETIGCQSDEDCEDGIDCTLTSCNPEHKKCTIAQSHDDFCDRMRTNETIAMCVPKSCFGGPMHTFVCATDADCYGGVCSSMICKGGLYNNYPCDQVKTWPRYSCEERGGICIPGKSDTNCFLN